MTVADLYEDDEYIEAFWQVINHCAESARLDAEELVEAGFSPVQVDGLASVVWEYSDQHFTTEEALREIRSLIKDSDTEAMELVEHDFMPVQVYGKDEVIWKRGERFHTRERALDQIRPTIEGEEA
jgi:hypothetical protein